MNEQPIDEAVHRVREEVQELEAVLDGLDQRLQKLVAEKPMWVLGGTLLAGFLAGRILARK